MFLFLGRSLAVCHLNFHRSIISFPVLLLVLTSFFLFAFLFLFVVLLFFIFFFFYFLVYVPSLVLLCFLFTFSFSHFLFWMHDENVIYRCWMSSNLWRKMMITSWTGWCIGLRKWRTHFKPKMPLMGLVQINLGCNMQLLLLKIWQ